MYECVHECVQDLCSGIHTATLAIHDENSMNANMYVCGCVHVCTCVCACVCVRVRACVCTYKNVRE